MSGFYTFTQDASTWGLNGSGDWTVEIENAYTASPGVTYDIEFVFVGPCEGDCPDPEACNYVSVEEQTNPLEDACLYAEDLYGVGYGCDGECLGDSDGDGICDATDTCDGVIDECGECAGTGMLGCTDVTACNYDENATCDDGGCLELDDCGECGGSGVLGCTDFMACNFDPSATCDSGGCLTFDECGECGGSGYWLVRTRWHAITTQERVATTVRACLTMRLACAEGHARRTPMPMAFAMRALKRRVTDLKWKR